MEWARATLGIIGLHVNYWTDTHQNFHLQTFSVRSPTVGHWVRVKPRICTLSKWRVNITSSSFHLIYPNFSARGYVGRILFTMAPQPPWAAAFTLSRIHDHTQRRTTLGRTPLDEWSTRRIDFYLTTHNTHNRQTFMPPAVFEPTISADERPQTPALGYAATGIGLEGFEHVIVNK